VQVAGKSKSSVASTVLYYHISLGIIIIIIFIYCRKPESDCNSIQEHSLKIND